MPDQTTAGGRIGQARDQLGLDLSQLARRIGVQRKTLENWENDRSEPRIDKLMRLAGVLQVPLLWLISGESPTGEDQEAAPETGAIAQKLERALAMQQDLAALLIDVSADVARLQRKLGQDADLAA